MAYGNFEVKALHEFPTAHPESGLSRRSSGFGGAEGARVTIPQSEEVENHQRGVIAAAKVGSIASEEAFRQAALEQEAMDAHTDREPAHH